MNRWLLLGYVANVAVILASLLTARGAIPGLDDGAALAASQGVLLLLFPAGLAMLRGRDRAQGTLRRALGLAVAILDIVLSLGALLAVVLVLFAGAKVVA